MVAQPERLTAPEIAERYGRSVSTIQTKWTQRDEWPAPVGRRGKWKEYDAAEVADVVQRLYGREGATTKGKPGDLLTVAEIAAYTGLSASTVRADISRGRIKHEPDDESTGVKRWRRDTIDAAMATRRGYRRK